MINKICESTLEAVSGIADGSTILMGGFGQVGHPFDLVDALIEQGARDLTIVANNGGIGESGISRLIELHRVRKLICTYPRAGSPAFEAAYLGGKIELEIVPQGTLVERMRAAAAGTPAFYSPTAVGTDLAKGKEVRSFGGRDYVLEYALHADVAFVEAWAADRWGNLVYRGAGQNFNPVMAMAGKLTVAQVFEIVELGTLSPSSIHTPATFVNRVALVKEDGETMRCFKNPEEALATLRRNRSC